MVKQIGSQYDFQKIPIIGLVAEQKLTAPVTPVNGQLWFDTTLNVLKVWEVNQWLLVANTAGGSTPAGPAGGDLTGSSYPNPTIAANAVTTVKLLDANVTMAKLASDTKDAVAGTSSLRKLGTGPTDAAAGNDGRFGAASPPNGTATGDLTGSYPNPQIAAGVIVLADLNTTLTDGTAASQQVRALGASTAVTTYGAAKADGTATTAARSDHTHGTPTHIGTDHAAISISSLAVPTADVAWGSKKITALLDPTNPQEAATKNYVDTTVQGLDPKASVRLATTTGANQTLTGAATIDSVAVANGDRVLVKDQSSQFQNGIYTANTGGAWSRAVDMDVWAEVPSAFVFVEEGTANADTGWVSTANAGGTLGTTSITWTQFSSAGAVTAGAGMTQSGQTLNVIANNGSLVVGADDIQVGYGGTGGNNGSAVTAARSDHAHAYVPTTTTLTTTAPLTIGGGASADLSANRTLAISNFTSGAAGAVPASGGVATNFLSADGTWKAPALDTTAGDARYGRKMSALVGALVAGVETLFTHSLGSQYVVAAFLDAATNRAIDFDWRAVSTTQIGITADVGYSASAVRAVVIG
jgi:hypothetical protein